MPNSSYDKDKGLGATEATETGTSHMKINHNFDIKKKLVLNGQSRIFNNWSEHSTITTEEFLENLEWVCNDPMQKVELKDGHTIERMTREIGLTPTGIVRLQRVNDAHGDFVGFYRQDGRLWEGEIFERSCTEAEKPFYGNTTEELHKIAISCRDHI